MVEITKHAEERYVERIMGYTERGDIISYIAENKDLITERLNKMLEFGTEIYEGKIRDGSYVHVVLKDTWILILDRKKAKVITLYKICLMSDDDEFNKLFVDKMRQKIEKLQNRKTVNRVATEKIVEGYQAKIKENNTRASEYEGCAAKLREQNKVYHAEIDAARAITACDEMEIKHAVEDLVAAKIF